VDFIIGLILESILELVGEAAWELIELAIGGLLSAMLFEIAPSVLAILPGWLQPRTAEYYVGSGLGYTNILGLRDDT
jgi:hypothetical protein